jgi:hypothetical protein
MKGGVGGTENEQQSRAETSCQARGTLAVWGLRQRNQWRRSLTAGLPCSGTPPKFRGMTSVIRQQNVPLKRIAWAECLVKCPLLPKWPFPGSRTPIKAEGEASPS